MASARLRNEVKRLWEMELYTQEGEASQASNCTSAWTAAINEVAVDSQAVHFATKRGVSPPFTPRAIPLFHGFQTLLS